MCAVTGTFAPRRETWTVTLVEGSDAFVPGTTSEPPSVTDNTLTYVKVGVTVLDRHATYASLDTTAFWTLTSVSY